jgi:hypothetical protein
MRAWNAEVERQSREMDGGDRAHRRFVANRWNFYEFPIPEEDMDHPLDDGRTTSVAGGGGFTGVDVFWAQVGHVLVGGCKERR